jgi:hypothetical protein
MAGVLVQQYDNGITMPEWDARQRDRPEQSGIQMLDGKRVWVKTFRIELPRTEKLSSEGQAGNMRQTVEDAVRAGELECSPARLLCVRNARLPGYMLMTYVVDLV